ncbi:MAG: HAD-IA family hydrolase [Chloroflexi bacterium]|nr:HAD-IA family hydrolase [Chloroflexota bacterium]
MSDIRAVFFDLYGTLAGFDPPREEIQSRAVAKFGLDVTKKGVDAGYHLADEFMTLQNSRKPIRALSGDEQWAFFSRFEQLVLQGAGHDVDLAAAGQIWAEVRKQKYRITLFPDVVDGLDRLRTHGLTVSVISNMNITGEQLCDDMGLVGHVDFATTSGETGYEKPDTRIFEAALARAGVEADQAVHVGDQLESDIHGAENSGIRPVLMDRYDNHQDYERHPRATDMDSSVALITEMMSG